MTNLDLVLAGGRVVDPSSGLDAMRHIGIRGNEITTLSEERLGGKRTIDVDGLVVCPGFVDLHVHVNDEATYRAQVQGGVTTSLELELGTNDVAGWYEERGGGQLVNYGVAIGHMPVRMAVMGDGGDMLPADRARDDPADTAAIAEMARALHRGFGEGALAAGFGIAYTPGAGPEEIDTMLRIVAGAGATAHIHIGAGRDGLEAVIAAAARTGAAIHLVHLNSVALDDAVWFLRRIDSARREGAVISAEAYPYTAGMTRIESSLFEGWESWEDDVFSSIEWVATGQRLDRDSFSRLREIGGEVITYSNTEEMVRTVVASPGTVVASDAFLVDGRGHPRSTGTFARVLGRYVRGGVLSLSDAIGKMTTDPARLLERRNPALRRKGRVAPGADADLAAFDPQRIIDRATYQDPTASPEGMQLVMVMGRPVIEGGEPTGARPGGEVRAPISGDSGRPRRRGR